MISFLSGIPLGVKITLSLITLLTYLVYKFFTKHFGYWEKMGVKCVKPVPIFGSASSMFLLKEHAMDFNNRLYQKYEGEPFIGLYVGRTPTLLAFDPELLKLIYVKDFSHFVDHGFKFHEEADPLQALSLFNLTGQRWKDMRAKLVPTFTSGKIKGMFPLMQECTSQFELHLEKLATTKEIFEVKDLMGCLFTDIIGTCIFGITCNTLKDPKNQFRVMGKKLIEVDFVQAFKGMLTFFMPDVAMMLKIATMPKDAMEFFKKLSKSLVEQRKTSKMQRKDFLQLLVELQEKGSVAIDADDEDQHQAEQEMQNSSASTFKMSDIELAAQATVFFLAGFETSSTVTTFVLIELAANPDVQRKAQLEIDEVLEKYNGKVTYEALKDMKYLECVLKESMRKYPPVPFLSRECTKTYTIPNTNVTIDKGTMVQIPICSLQNDPKYFPDPDRFDPERFIDDENSHKYQYIYSPFGEGPRQCIGNRFALIQSKIALLTFLRNYTLVFSPKTQYPVVFDKFQFIPTSKDGVWLQLEKRSED
ncbi:probable cytochrome P450 6a14 isoform X1 [Neocloeon triangulifer]|uniref:probable cytochrome P450 6a14 isoform X1 n=1 Tax=Neocloeon triangulifer TaxID=2078957 RepID=UPI00286ECD0F|nr:probable cytochrome P450 6a14 isoform X1 [Neocloeon triangulifer]